MCFLLLACLACNARSSLTPEKAIIGHWVTEDGKAHYYFTPNSFQLIEDGQPASRPIDYIVVSIDDKENKLRIQAGLIGIASVYRTLVFSSSNQKVLVEIEGFGIGPTRWNYVDSKQQP